MSMRRYINYLKAQPKLFETEVREVEDLSPWIDEGGPMRLATHPSGMCMPQDMMDFYNEQVRKGTMIIHTRDL